MIVLCEVQPVRFCGHKVHIPAIQALLLLETEALKLVLAMYALVSGLVKDFI